MFRYRWTIKELETVSNWKLLQTLIDERKSSCNNVYSPLYKRLQKLETWLYEQKKNTPDWKE